MQKKIAIFFTLLCLFSLTGCSKQNSDSKDGKKIITFWHTHNDDEANTLKEIIRNNFENHVWLRYIKDLSFQPSIETLYATALVNLNNQETEEM